MFHLFMNESKCKKKGAQVCRCAPHTSFELLHLCSGVQYLYACRGQRQRGGYYKHPVGDDNHGHRHNRIGGYLLMFHLLAQSSRFPNYPVAVIAKYHAITFSNRNITVTIVVCQDLLSLDERSSSCY